MRWPRWMRRKPHKGGRRHLEDYERTVILRKVREQGWSRFGTSDLMAAYPDTFNKRYLGTTLKRMSRQGHLTRGHRSVWGGLQYEIRGRDESKRAA